jgi:hypothetical protein
VGAPACLVIALADQALAHDARGSTSAPENLVLGALDNASIAPPD